MNRWAVHFGTSGSFIAQLMFSKKNNHPFFKAFELWHLGYDCGTTQDHQKWTGEHPSNLS